MATFLRTIDDIALVGTYERGVPNAERITYRTQRDVNLAEYIVCLAAANPDGTVTPACNYPQVANVLHWMPEASKLVAGVSSEERG